MLSSNGTEDVPSWRSKPTLIVTGWAAVAAAGRVAQGGHELAGGRPRPRCRSAGRISMSSGSWPSSRVMAPEADSRSPVGGHQHDDGSDVVHEGPEAGLAAAGQLETPALGQVAQAEEDERSCRRVRAGCRRSRRGATP